MPRSSHALFPLIRAVLLVLATAVWVSRGASADTGPVAGEAGPAETQAQTSDAADTDKSQETTVPEGEESEEPAAPEGRAIGGKGAIGKIVVDGNVRVSDTAFFNSLHLKTGDPYDERAIQEEFRRLWDLDLFDDIIIESRKRPGDVYDLIFHVRDRPLVGNVTYVGMKAVTEANIQERLNQAKCEVRRGQPVDFSVLNRAEAAIEQLLGEKG